MSLGSPWMLLWLAVVPLLVLAYVRLVRRRSRRASRLASEGLVPTTSSATRAPLETPRSVRALRVRARSRVCRARPSDDELRPSAAGGDGHPRVRRLEQHAGGRPRADPDRGGEGGRDGVRRAAAEHDPDRGRRVRRQRRDGAPADEGEGGRGCGDPAPRGERRHLARSRPLHLPQHDRRETTADRRVRAGERQRRGRHRVLRLVGDRPALGWREHVAPRPHAARGGRVLGRCPCPCDRDRDTGRNGRGGRRIQRRDGPGRGTADADRGRDRRQLPPGRRRRHPRADLRVRRPRSSPPSSASARSPPCSRPRAGSCSRSGRSSRSPGSGGSSECRSPGRSLSSRSSSCRSSSASTGGCCEDGADRRSGTRASRCSGRCCRGASAGSATSRSPSSSRAWSRSASPQDDRTSNATSPMRGRRSSSRSTSRGRCARRTSSRTGWPSPRRRRASSSRTSPTTFAWASWCSRGSRSWRFRRRRNVRSSWRRSTR